MNFLQVVDFSVATKQVHRQFDVLIFSMAIAKRVPLIIREQIMSDPQLPRPKPTTSLWQEPINRWVGSVESSLLPQKADFVVIGSGVAACGVVRSLLTNSGSGKASVALLEARGLCSGATGRNGGQLTRLPPTRHKLMVENFGEEQARKVMRLTVKGLDMMHGLAESQGPEFLKRSKKQRTEKFFAYYDQDSWLETVEAIELFEQEVPEDRGVYELVSKEETASVRITPA